MLLPTDIPSALHIDLESRNRIEIDRALDAKIQAAMIRTHKTMMELEQRKQVSELEAAKDWVSKGWAISYRQHYIIKPRNQ